jgi:hypothetical protein
MRDWLYRRVGHWSQKQRYAATSICIAGLWCAWWFFSFRHILSSISTNRQALIEYERNKQEFDRISRELDQAPQASQISHVANVSSIALSDLINKATHAGLIINVVRMLTPEPGQGFENKQTVFELMMNGDFEALISFLQACIAIDGSLILDRCTIKRHRDTLLECHFVFF